MCVLQALDIDDLSVQTIVKVTPSQKEMFQISKFGGLTRAKQAVELCSSLGIAMTIEVININNAIEVINQHCLN